MAAADTDAMEPAPPTPSPPASRKRNIAASLARAHHRLALAADDAALRLLLAPAVGDAFLLLSLASVWLLAASLAAMHVGRVVWGVDCAVALAAARVGTVAALSFVVFCTPALLVFIIRAALAYPDTDEAGEHDFEGPVPKSLAAAAQEVFCNTVKLGLLATLPFILLMFVGGLLEGNSHVKKSGIGAVGTLAADVLYCFIIIPTAALRVWKVARPGWRCHPEVEKYP